MTMVALARVSKPSPRAMVGATSLTWPSISVGAPLTLGATFTGAMLSWIVPLVEPPPPSLTVTPKLSATGVALLMSPPVCV